MEEIKSTWHGLNYYQKLDLLAQVGLPASDAWLDWAALSDDAKETITKAFSQSSPLSRTLVERHGPVEQWEHMDTHKKSIISPEGEEDYSDERWNELLGKYTTNPGGGRMGNPKSEEERRETHKAKYGEFYAEYDEGSALWCVFHTENGHAYSSWPSKEEAEADAKQRNEKLPPRGTGLERHSNPGNPVALAPDEEAIPEFAEKIERCVVHLKGDKGVIDPYATCRASLREKYGLDG